MLIRFDKYQNLSYRVLVVATVMDPKYKMKLIELYFPMIYGECYGQEIDYVKTSLSKSVK